LHKSILKREFYDFTGRKIKKSVAGGGKAGIGKSAVEQSLARAEGGD
jgi:hypothetical protein